MKISIERSDLSRPDCPSDIERIRNGLRQPGVTGIEYHCFAKWEADEIAAQLAPAERSRVRFFWNVFGSALEEP